MLLYKENQWKSHQKREWPLHVLIFEQLIIFILSQQYNISSSSSSNIIIFFPHFAFGFSNEKRVQRTVLAVL
ncbi:hypothetical protein T4D_8068 [Trichinella pseudospiralis]|uniref:Uncharacterized protein n=1 Tax=Trichinella pseudospiralis TaxID=6337 RepID=A0A0V1F8L2_TRIPS|nr:hypothetical protein T4D_8068 [Trichinella pseudospiralis]